MNQHNDQLPVVLLAQLVEHCTGIQWSLGQILNFLSGLIFTAFKVEFITVLQRLHLTVLSKNFMYLICRKISLQSQLQDSWEMCSRNSPLINTWQPFWSLITIQKGCHNVYWIKMFPPHNFLTSHNKIGTIIQVIQTFEKL